MAQKRTKIHPAFGRLMRENQWSYSVLYLISCNEEEKLLDASPKWLQDLIIFSLEKGLRQGETLNLQWPMEEYPDGDEIRSPLFRKSQSRC